MGETEEGEGRKERDEEGGERGDEILLADIIGI